MNNVEKTTIYILRNKYSNVMPRRPTALFVVPILNCTDYMSFIRSTKHNFNFVHGVIGWIFEQHINAPTSRLSSFFLKSFKITEAKTRWVLPDHILKPGLTVSRFSNTLHGSKRNNVKQNITQ
ncbi:hypothetical protein AGRA671_24690 [Agrobacterium radiobacter]|nr:Uncharacterised protein [Agrobacterium tumefaciens]